MINTLKEAADAPQAVAPAACRVAVAGLGSSAALGEASSLLGDLDEASLRAFASCCSMIEPTAVQALREALDSEQENPAYTRARDIVRGYGAAAIPHMAAMVEDRRWFVQRTVAVLLGGTRSAAAVSPLQALLRRGDERVLRAAVSALAGIDDVSAARAIQTVLRAATGASRSAVVDALVAERDPRVVPMLARMLAEADPFGDDHQNVLDTLDAMRQLADERAVPAVAGIMAKKRMFARRKTLAFKMASVQVLRAIGTARSQQALDDASRSRDRLLRKLVAQRS